MNVLDKLRYAIEAGHSDSAYQYLGCHRLDGGRFVFRVWAPNARSVRLLGRFNDWDTTVPPMKRVEGSGVFEEISDMARLFDEYKYYIERPDGTFVMKADPYAFHTCTPPETASRVFDLSGFAWRDKGYRTKALRRDPLASPVNIYELHLGSWMRYPDGNPYSYRALAKELVPYLAEMNYTHVELLPVAEHPYDLSWGYQVTGFYAPTSRFGTPHDFMAFVDACHQAGIGVILDWVGAHFPKDECGLYEFDGTCCYESSDPAYREHPTWGTRLFDYTRNEVRSFLRSNVCFWLREYHIDGIRVDAVSNMIYRDYATDPDCWRREEPSIRHAATSLLREINRAATAVNPAVLMIAEEATAFPKVTRPDYDGGLGFHLKWNMGWMHDTLDYVSSDPLYRKHLHEKLTFSLTYAFSENYVLPFSHDEVVHGKRSMIGRMPGEYEDKFATLRTLYAYQMAHPGKKLNFMGNEFAQFIEWNPERELDWFLLSYDSHRRMRTFVRDLNALYRSLPALWQNDGSWEGFRWVQVEDRDNSVFAFRRIAREKRKKEVIAVFNFCPVFRPAYRIGLPPGAYLCPIFSTDCAAYGGSGIEMPDVKMQKIPWDGLPYSACVDLPPLSATFYHVYKEKRKEPYQNSRKEA